jgi:glycosyltransferase involved in cell wall biosynthesis
MRICIVPEYPVSLMTGGLQVQAIETWVALNALGEDLQAELFSWSDHRPLPDLYHFIGFPPHCGSIAELVRQAGRPYVVTMLLGNPRRGWWLRLALLKQQIMSTVLGLKTTAQTMRDAAGIVAITQADARAARAIFGIMADRIQVVANGVDESFFNASPAAWWRAFGRDPFVLCVGAIQQRKNQLMLVEACNQARLPVVLLGPVLPGEKDYGVRVGAALEKNKAFGGRWLQHLQKDDPLLISAYAACRLFVLLSQAETQPLSVMQAMAARCTVLLLESNYTKDALFRGLPIVKRATIHALASGIRLAWEQPRPTELPRTFTWLEVARRLACLYSDVLRRTSAFPSKG